MSTYPNLINDPELLKIKTKDDEIKDLKYENEKHDLEILLKSLKIDNEIHKKKYKSLNKKKISLVLSVILIGSGSILTSSTLSNIIPSIVNVVSSSTVFVTYINHECIHMKTKFTISKTKVLDKFLYNSIRENIKSVYGG